MTKWQSGDIITDKRWNELNSVYPLYKKIEIAADSPYNSLSDGSVYFDIQMSELRNLLNYGVTCWFKDGYNSIINISERRSDIITAGIDDTRAAIEPTR